MRLSLVQTQVKFAISLLIMPETSLTLRDNLSVSSLREHKRTANHINLDSTLSHHQPQVITVMVKPSPFASRDSFMKMRMARKLKVSAQTTFAILSQEMKL